MAKQPLPRHEIFDAIYVRGGNRLLTRYAVWPYAWHRMVLIASSVNLNNALRRALMKIVSRQPWRQA